MLKSRTEKPACKVWAQPLAERRWGMAERSPPRTHLQDLQGSFPSCLGSLFPTTCLRLRWQELPISSQDPNFEPPPAMSASHMSVRWNPSCAVSDPAPADVPERAEDGAWNPMEFYAPGLFGKSSLSLQFCVCVLVCVCLSACLSPSL